MIVATPLDLAPLKPDSWDAFWAIWNTHSANLVKTSNNSTNNVEVGESALWRGLDIYAAGNVETLWAAPLVNIKSTLPILYYKCATLPIKNVFRVRLLASMCNFRSHTDENLDAWSIRAYFHYTDPEDQWYVTKPNDEDGLRHYLHVPLDTNWFAYNDKFCWHGTDYNPEHPKILLQVYAAGSNELLINKSINKYKEYTITL